MKIYPSPEARHFYLVAVLSAVLNVSSAAFANSYILERNTWPYSLKGLGPVDAKAFNDIGQVVGTYTTPDGFLHGFITGPAAMGRKTLETLGGAFIGVAGVNATGQVAGTSLTVTGSTHAFITGANGTGITDIGTLGGSYSEARGINASGQVIGVSATATGRDHGFITGPNGKGMTDLGDFEPRGINSSGQMAGYSEGHAFLTNSNGTGRTDLGLLYEESGVRGNGFVRYRAVPIGGINDVGQVIVNLEDCAIGYGMCHYSASVVPNGFGSDDAFLVGINNAGDTLGVHAEHAGSSYPLIDGVSLNGGSFWPTLPGADLTAVFAINNAGQILVAGDPVPQVPEPEAYAMVIAGLALMGFVIGQKGRRGARRERLLDTASSPSSKLVMSIA